MKTSPKNLASSVREVFSQSDRPLLMKELMQLMHCKKGEQREIKRFLRKMVRSGEIIRVGGNRYGLSDQMALVIGRLKGHREGYGFVIPDDEEESDIYIGAKQFNDAMHGDRVGARIEKTKADGKREGRIIRVLERAHTQIVGRYALENHFGYVTPSNRRIVHDLFISPENRHSAKEGDIVLAEILAYPTKHRNPEGKIIKVLGLPTAPEIDTETVIHEYHLSQIFPSQAIKAAKKIDDGIGPETIDRRVDLRELPTVTIDGETAHDFDDAVSIEKLEDGFRLWVHIADVAHYVPEGAPLDQEAFRRSTSIYFPDKVLPMFPERLSNGICSLKPKEDRLTLTVEIDFDRHGHQQGHKIYESVIQSSARMTYTAVWKIISHSDNAILKRYSDLVPHFECMEALARQLHQLRVTRGSLDFELPEPQIVLGPRGETLDIIRGERNFAHQIIEEFMLAANETIASHLTRQGIPLLYRIHEPPAPDRIDAFNELVTYFGLSQHRIGKKVHSKMLSAILGQVKGHTEENLINQVLLRSMRKARYSEENKGHFGLASTTYTHFTSPIRRYPDLVVHRILKSTLNAKMTETEKDTWAEKLPTIAQHSSDQERIAIEAEREVIQRKQVKFMADKIGKRYSGLITGVTAFGLFVMLEDVFVEGLVHVSSLNDDYYIHQEKSHALIGRNKKRSYRLGQVVEVVVEQADIENWQVDLKIVSGRRKRR